MHSASGYGWADLLAYRERVEGVWVISLRGLRLMKEGGRLKDRADAEQIRKALGEWRGCGVATSSAPPNERSLPAP